LLCLTMSVLVFLVPTSHAVCLHPHLQQPEEGAPGNSQRVAAPKASTGTEKVQTVERLVEERWLEYCSADGEPEDGEERGNGRREGRGSQSQSQGAAAGIKLGIRYIPGAAQYLRSIEGVARCDSCGAV